MSTQAERDFVAALMLKSAREIMPMLDAHIFPGRDITYVQRMQEIYSLEHGSNERPSTIWNCPGVQEHIDLVMGEFAPNLAATVISLACQLAIGINPEWTRFDDPELRLHEQGYRYNWRTGETISPK